jgi:hypothetical protein
MKTTFRIVGASATARRQNITNLFAASLERKTQFAGERDGGDGHRTARGDLDDRGGTLPAPRAASPNPKEIRRYSSTPKSAEPYHGRSSRQGAERGAFHAD